MLFSRFQGEGLRLKERVNVVDVGKDGETFELSNLLLILQLRQLRGRNYSPKDVDVRRAVGV